MEKEIHVTIERTSQKIILLFEYPEKLERVFQKKNITVSHDSELGKALRGKKIGEIGSYVTLNQELIQFRVKKITEINNKNFSSKTIGIGSCLVQHSSVERGSWDN